MSTMLLPVQTASSMRSESNHIGTDYRAWHAALFDALRVTQAPWKTPPGANENKSPQSASVSAHFVPWRPALSRCRVLLISIEPARPRWTCHVGSCKRIGASRRQRSLLGPAGPKRKWGVRMPQSPQK